MTNASYEYIPIQESREPVVDLSKFDFILEPKYFMGGVSGDKRIFLREGVVRRLDELQKELKGFKIKIWDGFRSRIVQNTLLNNLCKELAIKQPTWSKEEVAHEAGVFITLASDANRIPPHATGGAVDLTLVDASGSEVDMGTEFDHFGPEAHVEYFASDSPIGRNRTMLRELLRSRDFVQYSDEWWHFDYGNQLWAMNLHKPFAIYGEVIAPEI